MLASSDIIKQSKEINWGRLAARRGRIGAAPLRQRTCEATASPEILASLSGSKHKIKNEGYFFAHLNIHSFDIPREINKCSAI